MNISQGQDSKLGFDKTISEEIFPLTLIRLYHPTVVFNLLLLHETFIIGSKSIAKDFSKNDLFEIMKY